MHRIIPALLGLALILAQFAAPALVGAAPTLAVSPAAGPRGTTTVTTVSGLPAETNLLFQFVRGSGNTNTTRIFEAFVRSNEHGDLRHTYTVGAEQPGAYTIRIVAIGGSVLATAPFTVIEGAGPTITLTPDRGACATAPELGGTGFQPYEAVIFNQQRLGEDGTPIGTPSRLNLVQAGPTGDLPRFTIATLPFDCTDAAPATPEGARIRFIAFAPGTDPAAATTPGRQAVFTVDRGGATPGEPVESRTFPETGFTVRGRFLAYWRAHGLDLGDPGRSERESLALFGYPISGEFTQRLEDGKEYTVQYFERARFEYHPEHAGTPYAVQLGQFGRQIAAAVPGAPTPAAPASLGPGGRYFPETGHNVQVEFITYWERNGGLAVFGLPVSEQFEQQLEDGRRYSVQYFERARFERHLENAPPYDILLGQFGRQILGQSGGATPAR